MVSPEIDLFLCVLAPFAAAAVAPALHRIFDRWTGTLLALLPAFIFFHLCSFITPVVAGQTITLGFDWVPALGIRFSLLIDGLSLCFALLISGIGTLILIYSGTYLEGHLHRGRFLGFMLAFMGAMLGLVLADNMVALYGFWELTSVTSFLLIGYDHIRQPARRAAIQALVITNIGGLALLVGVIALWLTFGTWDLSGMAALHDAVRNSSVYPLVLAAFVVAAFTKSAQFPLHFWLPAAMQAPTPVSAYLHSATMVQAGVYLLMRTTPTLGSTPAWSLTLMGFGGVTLLWGAFAALRQTDLKQLLAQSTVASLGMLVLLLGIGSEAAIAGAVIYFVAHALYIAALFLLAGVVEHGTGTRDVTMLGGLRDFLTISFLTSVVAAVSMVGFPPALGFFAKEETYAAVAGWDWPALAPLVAMIIGNVLLTAVALTVALRPFMGILLATPREPHEGPLSLLVGPVLLAGLGIAAGWMTASFASVVTAPVTSAILGHAVPVHDPGGIDVRNPSLLLSLLTWTLGGLLYWQLNPVRERLVWLAKSIGWTFEAGFDALMFGLVRLAGLVTRLWHHGRLELYMVVVFGLFALVLIAPFLMTEGNWPDGLALPELTFYEWATVGVAAIGIVTVLLARTRLFAIIALGVQGLAVSLLYMLFGAPDLSFTQFMVEILSVVIFALVMTRLRLENRDTREFEDLLRDGTIALLGGVGIVLVLLKVLERPVDARLSTFFGENSAAVAHGRNIVNVILVDFRGLDTLGEISVVMAAGMAILVLARRKATGQPSAPPARRRRRSKPSGQGAAA